MDLTLKYCKTLKNVEKLIIQIAFVILLKGVLCKMPLIHLKTEKNVIYEILHRKRILQHEKVVFNKMCLSVEKG